jgi:hypothetical protein
MNLLTPSGESILTHQGAPRREFTHAVSGIDEGAGVGRRNPGFMRRLYFFVPLGAPEGMDPGSAIVSMDGDAQPGDLITVDFESNRHGYANLGTYREKLLAAASRHVDRYPTRARAQILRSALAPVGFCD